MEEEKERVPLRCFELWQFIIGAVAAIINNSKRASRIGSPLMPCVCSSAWLSSFWSQQLSYWKLQRRQGCKKRVAAFKLRNSSLGNEEESRSKSGIRSLYLLFNEPSLRNKKERNISQHKVEGLPAREGLTLLLVGSKGRERERNEIFSSVYSPGFSCGRENQKNV